MNKRQRGLSDRERGRPVEIVQGDRPWLMPRSEVCEGCGVPVVGRVYAVGSDVLDELQVCRACAVALMGPRMVAALDASVDGCCGA
jgi:hypothetical protein